MTETNDETTPSQTLSERPQATRPPGILSFTTFDEAWRAAQVAADSAIVPDTYRKKPQDVLIAWQQGAEVGLPPMQSLTAFAVVNGKPAPYGDGFLAILNGSPVFEDIEETFDEETNTATCTMWRKGRRPVSRSFSLAEAEQAGLYPATDREGKPSPKSPWNTYTRRMLQMRARGFAGRDLFPDVLRGMVIYEEAVDTAAVKDVELEVVADEPSSTIERARAKMAERHTGDASDPDPVPGHVDPDTGEILPDEAPRKARTTDVRSTIRMRTEDEAVDEYVKRIEAADTAEALDDLSIYNGKDSRLSKPVKDEIARRITEKRETLNIEEPNE